MFKFIQFFAELAQFHLHFRQTSLCDGCLEILFQLHRRGTDKLATVLYATGNTRLCAKVHFVANMNMTCNAYLPAEHAPFSYLGRTCYTYLRRHYGVGAIIGGYASGAVVDAFSVYAEGGGLVSRDWTPVWLIFAGYALVIGLLFGMVFRYKHNPEKIEKN